MRALGRTPSLLVGAPDDNAEDAAYRDAATLRRAAMPRPATRRAAPRPRAD
jgi:hypothetical protein